MPTNSADAERPESLSRVLAEGTGRDAEEIEREADEVEIEDPEDAEQEFVDEDWTDSSAYQEY